MGNEDYEEWGTTGDGGPWEMRAIVSGGSWRVGELHGVGDHRDGGHEKWGPQGVGTMGNEGPQGVGDPQGAWDHRGQSFSGTDFKAENRKYF